MKAKTPQYLQECRAALSVEQTRSLAATDNWAHVDKQKVHQDWVALYLKLAPLVDSLAPSAETVQALIAEHYSIATRFYTPTKEAYIGLGLFYGDNADMMKYHNAYHSNMVPFLAAAIAIYADANL